MPRHTRQGRVSPDKMFIGELAQQYGGVNVKLTAALFAASTALITITAAPASADTDSEFLAKLSKDGINAAPDQMIAIAHETCDAVHQDHSGYPISPYQAAMLNVTSQLGSQGLTKWQISQFRGYAIMAYCPDQKDWHPVPLPPQEAN
jgi:Protein of unknown function (DUF732)